MTVSGMKIPSFLGYFSSTQFSMKWLIFRWICLSLTNDLNGSYCILRPWNGTDAPVAGRTACIVFASWLVRHLARAQATGWGMNALSPIPWASANLQVANFPPSLFIVLVAPPLVQIAKERYCYGYPLCHFPGSMNRLSYSLLVLCVWK